MTAIQALQKEIAETEKKLKALHAAVAALGGESKAPAPKKVAKKRTKQVARQAVIHEAVKKLTGPMPKANLLATVSGRCGAKERAKWNAAVHYAIDHKLIPYNDGLVMPPTKSHPTH